MLIIGLLIVVAAAAFAGVVVSENWGGGTYAVKGFGHLLGHYTLAQIFSIACHPFANFGASVLVPAARLRTASTVATTSLKHALRFDPYPF